MATEGGSLPVTIPYCGVTTVHKCSKCNAVFVQINNATRHRDTTCPGAEFRRIKCALVEMGDDGSVVNAQPGGAGGTINISGVTINGNNNIIVIGDQYGDIIKAGTAEEQEAILQTILSNPQVRAATTNPYNAVAGIFQSTKGTRGPHRLRNVYKADRRVVEIGPDGCREHKQLDYCRAEALRLVRLLRHGADAVRGDPGAARHLREWAADVIEMLTGGDPPTYGERLERYCRSEPGFYKLPKQSRDEVMTAVKNIGPLIVVKK